MSSAKTCCPTHQCNAALKSFCWSGEWANATIKVTLALNKLQFNFVIEMFNDAAVNRRTKRQLRKGKGQT